MKKIILAGSFLALTISFSACSYTQKSGVDKCGNQYTDTTYRTYNNLNNPCYPKNVKFSNSKNQNFITPISRQSGKCSPELQQNCPPPPPAPAPAPVVAKKPVLPQNTPVLTCDKPLKVTVIGQGVAPCNGACSPSQAYALAKRAAIADAYRLIAEKVKGVYVEGDDLIKNMMVKRSTIKTSVAACIRNANVTETTFKDGLCEVEMEVVLSHSQFAQ